MESLRCKRSTFGKESRCLVLDGEMPFRCLNGSLVCLEVQGRGMGGNTSSDVGGKQAFHGR